MADLGMLVAMLGMFENQTSLFPNAAFEDEDGEPVLVVQGDVDNVRFLRQQNGQPTDHFGSGHVRERVALRALVRNEWFEALNTGTHLRIKLGERARKLREGKEDTKTAA